ncbi:DnaJ domain-containing protein [Eubacterium ramulus]|uniref:DnaJ domain protein n=1 Tax=Eubacterium ramulus ATCC 29099 TaxID=1256908 RepID=U2P5X5_EUBRA|nr:DnaJ domain-containing protein [Eubacterium ramulus]ERK45895.1 DnaJ domain protein [Eubacterium ramulus ATCC 29099]
MDKAQAYAVLRIEPGCTEEEIKKAYAALSRQYHPEEYPEEFQQIHDAYRMLRRQEQRQHTIHPVTVTGTKEADSQSADINALEETELQSVEVNVTEEADPETSSGVPAEQELEEQTENPEQSEAVPQYDFDEVIEEEQREEEQKQIYFIQKALIEMEMLLKPQYCNKVKLFQEYFRKAEYQEILKQPVYMGMFAELLENSRLKPVIYDHIIDYYRFRGLNPEDMYEGAAKLYRVLDEKRGMKKKKTGTLQTVILVGAVAGVRAGTRSVSSDSGAGKLFGFLAVLVIVIALMFLLYRQLYKNHSGLFAQAITALLLTVSQFIVLMGDFYAPLMGTDAGTGLAVILFLLGGVWIIVVGIAAVVKKLLFLKK